MRKTCRKTFLSALLAFVLIAVMVLPANACKKNQDNSQESGTEQGSTVNADVTELGEGEKSFSFEVVLADETTSKFLIHTNESTVGAALLALELIAGDESDYGLYVKTVNGVTADYDVDGTYWAFYAGGEYASAGVDSTEIVEGETYAFKVEK